MYIIGFFREKFHHILAFGSWLYYTYYKVEKEFIKITKNEDFIHRQ